METTWIQGVGHVPQHESTGIWKFMAHSETLWIKVSLTPLRLLEVNGRVGECLPVLCFDL